MVADAAVALKKVTSVFNLLKHHEISDVSIAASKSET
jgi:biopolymer transport protein ExbD